MSTKSINKYPEHVQNPIRVVIVGGCYAGLAAATNLLDLCEGRPPRFAPTTVHLKQQIPIEIIIIDERDGYYHLIGSPLALASETYADKAWVKFSEIPGLQHPAIRFIHGSVINVDMRSKTAHVRPHDRSQVERYEYDYIVAASGLRRVWPVVPQAFTKQKYLSEVSTHIDKVRSAKDRVVVIGGGAVGIEMAAELKLVEPSLKVTLVHSRDHLLSTEPLPDDFKDATLAVLRDSGVEVLMGKRVNNISEAEADGRIALTLSDGSAIAASHVINAISRSTLTTGYLPSSVLDEEGYVVIKPTLQIVNNGKDEVEDGYHYAAGDIALWSGIKRCGAAMHMGCLCAHNIYQHMALKHMASCPSSPYASRASDSFNDISISRSVGPEYKELSEHVPVMGIAIGASGAAYSPVEGTKTGPEVLNYLFGDDLGFINCYNYMKLAETPATLLEKTTGIDRDAVTVDLVEGKNSRDQATPTLSATSTESPGIEPQTPIDAVGNAEVTNFEVFEKIGQLRNLDVDTAVAEIRG